MSGSCFSPTFATSHPRPRAHPTLRSNCAAGLLDGPASLHDTTYITPPVFAYPPLAPSARDWLADLSNAPLTVPATRWDIVLLLSVPAVLSSYLIDSNTQCILSSHFDGHAAGLRVEVAASEELAAGPMRILCLCLAVAPAFGSSNEPPPPVEQLPPLPLTQLVPSLSFSNPFSQYAQGVIPGWQYGGGHEMHASSARSLHSPTRAIAQVPLRSPTITSRSRRQRRTRSVGSGATSPSRT